MSGAWRAPQFFAGLVGRQSLRGTWQATPVLRTRWLGGHPWNIRGGAPGISAAILRVVVAKDQEHLLSLCRAKAGRLGSSVSRCPFCFVTTLIHLEFMELLSFLVIRDHLADTQRTLLSGSVLNYLDIFLAHRESYSAPHEKAGRNSRGRGPDPRVQIAIGGDAESHRCSRRGAHMVGRWIDGRGEVACLSHQDGRALSGPLLDQTTSLASTT